MAPPAAADASSSLPLRHHVRVRLTARRHPRLRMQIARARSEGQRVIGEAVASGLVLDESALWTDTEADTETDIGFACAAKFVMSPPIRRLAVDGVALQGALATGALQLVGTDHCAFNSTQKAAGRRAAALSCAELR